MFSRRTEWKLSPNRFTEALQELRAQGRELLDLSVSNPTEAGISYDAEVIPASLGAKESLNYDPQPKGLRSAREAVAGYYGEHQCRLDTDALVLTTSTSEGYTHVFRLLCNAGDDVLVPKPSYPLFEFLADLADVKLAPYPLLFDHGWQIDFPSLEKALTPRTRAIVVVHPNNPTGSYASEAERGQLNEVCRKHDLALIVDEVFLDYAHDGAPRFSFARNQDALTFTLSGLSKISGLPQMKLAWIATTGPEEQVREALARLEVIADTYLSVNTPIQLAAPALLEYRKKIQPQLSARVSANLGELDQQLAQQKLVERLLVQGGWYAVLRVPATRSDEELAIELAQEARVLVHPGHFYDFPTDGYLVVSLITPEDVFRTGTKRMLDWFKP